MANSLLFWFGSLIPIVWGVTHFFPTGAIVKGFGSISEDNRRIIAMEWITEGVALVFIGSVALTATIVEPAAPVSVALYWICVAGLNVLSIVSLFTGFRVRFLPFRLCPAIFTGSSILIVLGLLI
jgi:hypothetical protein